MKSCKQSIIEFILLHYWMFQSILLSAVHTINTIICKAYIICCVYYLTLLSAVLLILLILCKELFRNYLKYDHYITITVFWRIQQIKDIICQKVFNALTKLSKIFFWDNRARRVLTYIGFISYTRDLHTCVFE